MTPESYTLITSRVEFASALREALRLAVPAQAREIFFADADFSEWPLNEAEVIDDLGAWAGAGRKLVVYAASFDEMARRQLRFVEWRRPWSHVVQCRSDDEIDADKVPTLLLVAGQVCVRLVDRVQFRGSISTRAIDLVECREAVDALLQRSVETFPVTTLGL